MKGLIQRLIRLWVRIFILLDDFYRKNQLVSNVVNFVVGLIRSITSFGGGLFDLCKLLVKKTFETAKKSSLNFLGIIVVTTGIAAIIVILNLPEPPKPAPVVQSEIPREQRPTYYIGAILSLSGKYERIGNDMRRGYDFAIEAINADSGVLVNDIAHNLGLIIYDDESSPVRATEVAERLFTIDQPEIVLTPYSSLLANPVVTRAVEHNIVSVVPVASSAGMNTTTGKAFLLQTPPANHLVTAAELFVEHVNTRISSAEDKQKVFVNGETPKVAIVVTPDAHATQVINAVIGTLEKGEIQDIEIINVNLEGEEFDEEISKLNSVDALFMSAYADNVTKVFEEIDTKEINIGYIALTHCLQARLASNKPTVAEGAICALDWQTESVFTGTKPIVKPFVPTYYNIYGVNPTQYAAAAVAAIQVIAKALPRNKQNATLESALALINLPTIYGQIKFNNLGINVGKPMVLSQISQSRYIPIEPNSVAKKILILYVQY